MTTRTSIALLIDCEGAPPRCIDQVIGKLTPYGTINIRRAYGNWKYLQGWEEKLHPFAIQPIQQFAYTKGKNAIDICMTMDAMELLLVERIDIFALVTSDSDFTPLVMRLLSKGKRVFGFGESKTPEAFKKACSVFVHTDIPEPAPRPPVNAPAKPTPAKSTPAKSVPKTPQDLRQDEVLLNVLRAAVENHADASGLAKMGDIGQYLTEQSLTPKMYGFKRWSDVLRATGLFTEVGKHGGLSFKCNRQACGAPLSEHDEFWSAVAADDIPEYDEEP